MKQVALQIGLVGIGAGAAAALLFASVLSGSLLSVFLFYLAPLPIMIAALGWSHWAGLLAAVSAAAALALTFDAAFFFLAFFASVGLPAWWLGYLALLARPTGDAENLEWYPAGRLVVWTAVLGALVAIAAIVVVIAVFVMPQLSSDQASFDAALRSVLERMLRAQTGTPANAPLSFPGLSDPSRLIDVLAIIVPPLAAIVATLTQLLNLWLAGRVVKISGRLRRPWPDLTALRFPPLTPFALAAAIAGSFLPGVAGTCASLFAASLLIAYAVLGFAVLHGITRHTGSRAAVLAGVYAAVIVFGWPMLLMSLLGLIDTALDLRGRIAARRGLPPT
jgi:hypothetical protein